MTIEVTRENAERILRGVIIPPRPALLLDINEELKKADPDIRRIAGLVSRDVGISASVLKTVNSPLFGLRAKVAHPLQAVQMLGVKNIRNIVTGLVLRTALGSKTPSLEHFWDRSEKAAQIAVFLSGRLPHCPKDEVYLFGLFHDCGIPLLLQRFPDYQETLNMTALSDLPLTEIEDQRHKTNHAVLGYMVAKSWGLPANLCEAILRHHDLSVFDLGDNENPLVPNLVALNYLAERLHKMIMLYDYGRAEEGIEIPLEHLGLSKQEYADIREDILAMFT